MFKNQSFSYCQVHITWTLQYQVEEKIDQKPALLEEKPRYCLFLPQRCYLNYDLQKVIIYFFHSCPSFGQFCYWLTEWMNEWVNE